MIEWALIYTDGSIFTSEDGEPWQAPRDMVQFSVWRDEQTGWGYAESGIGLWGWREDMGHFHGFENQAAWESYQRVYKPWPLTVFGWELSDEAFQAMKKDVDELMGEPRTARRWSERRL